MGCISPGGISDMFFLEVALDHVGSPLPTPQVASNGSRHFLLIAWALAPHGVAFHILIQHLIRVEFLAIAGQKEKAQLLAMLLHPLFDLARAMHWMAVDNQSLS